MKYTVRTSNNGWSAEFEANHDKAAKAHATKIAANHGVGDITLEAPTATYYREYWQSLNSWGFRSWKKV